MSTKRLLILAFVFGVFATSRGEEGACEVSCNFNTDTCSWNNDANVTVEWSRTYCLLQCNPLNSYMSLKMKDVSINDTGRLSTPWLRGSINETCVLQFDYYIQKSNECQLSVLFRTKTSMTSLWMTANATKGKQFKESPKVDVPCDGNAYQIVFEGKKISKKSCGDEIYIDAVEFEVTLSSSTTTSTTSNCSTDPAGKSMTATGSTLCTQSTHATGINTGVADSHSQENSDDIDEDVGQGFVAAIIILVVIAVVVIAFTATLCLLRKRAQSQGNSEHSTVKLCCTKLKRVPDTDHLSSSLTGHQLQHHNNQTGSSAVHSGSDNVYSTAEDEGYDLTSLSSSDLQRGQQAAGAQDDYNVLSLRDSKTSAPASTPAETYPRFPMEQHAVSSPPVGDQAIPVEGASQDDYNALSLRDSKHSIPKKTYHHTSMAQEGARSPTTNGHLSPKAGTRQDDYNDLSLKDSKNDASASIPKETYHHISMAQEGARSPTTNRHLSPKAGTRQDDYNDLSLRHSHNVASASIPEETYQHLDMEQEGARSPTTHGHLSPKEGTRQDVYNALSLKDSKNDASASIPEETYQHLDMEQESARSPTTSGYVNVTAGSSQDDRNVLPPRDTNAAAPEETYSHLDEQQESAVSPSTNGNATTQEGRQAASNQSDDIMMSRTDLEDSSGELPPEDFYAHLNLQQGSELSPPSDEYCISAKEGENANRPAPTEKKYPNQEPRHPRDQRNTDSSDQQNQNCSSFAQGGQPARSNKARRDSARARAGSSEYENVNDDFEVKSSAPAASGNEHQSVLGGKGAIGDCDKMPENVYGNLDDTLGE
ncbi:uncharacterized protein [Littorina saxatilis]|uniref:MAM domain-containing protein n=1 Tax=Littorina saxatilis TaxID=31220 RepID=A0AAN9B489_9CAEN